MTSGDEFRELERKYHELQCQYDELRVLMAKLGIHVPEEERDRPRFTIIKGGLAAIVGLLAGLSLGAKRHPVLSASLVACTAGLAGVAVWPAQPPPHRTVLTPPRAPQRSRQQRGSPRPSAPGRSSPGHIHGAGKPDPDAAADAAHSSPAPSAQPVPAPSSRPAPSPAPKPKPSPVPTVSVPPHKHCLIWAWVLGKRVCVKIGLSDARRTGRPSGAVPRVADRLPLDRSLQRSGRAPALRQARQYRAPVVGQGGALARDPSHRKVRVRLSTGVATWANVSTCSRHADQGTCPLTCINIP